MFLRTDAFPAPLAYTWSVTKGAFRWWTIAAARRARPALESPGEIDAPLLVEETSNRRLRDDEFSIPRSPAYSWLLPRAP